MYVSLPVVQISLGLGGANSERIWSEGRAHLGWWGRGVPRLHDSTSCLATIATKTQLPPLHTQSLLQSLPYPWILLCGTCWSLKQHCSGNWPRNFPSSYSCMEFQLWMIVPLFLSIYPSDLCNPNLLMHWCADLSDVLVCGLCIIRWVVDVQLIISKRETQGKPWSCHASDRVRNLFWLIFNAKY